MTNHWIDIQNSDCILIMGSNPAENHPISFRWITAAMEKGATLISVDPRFTRSSAKAHIYTPIRSGTDIAFLGGMIRYILEQRLYHEEYVREYTNASFLVDPEFKLPEENNGVFSGLTQTPTGGVYEKSTWSFQHDVSGTPRKDKTLQDESCVFQLLKKQFSRYTPDIVASITGTPKEQLLRVYESFASTGSPDKSGTIMYAMGWTQHTVGTQNIRAMAIIQLLLGNMGVAGGGVNALRGESNVQGSTDHCLLFHILPGYLKTPLASQETLAGYLRAHTPETKEKMSANWWSNYPKYAASLIRAFYGTGVSLEEGYSYLPKLDDGANYSWLTIFDVMYKNGLSGFFAWGQNPACSGANAHKVRQALTKLDWLVNVNIFDNETGSFWQGPGMDPKTIKTEVFMLPAAASLEKEGSITNSGRWMQWRYKATDPPGEARPDGEIINELYYRVKALYEEESGAFPDPILKVTWDYGFTMPTGEILHFDPHRVAKEINGYFLKDTTINDTRYKKGTLVPSFVHLQGDGSTASGNWLYCGSYTEEGNMAARRSREDPSGIGLYHHWAWCWPANRRIIYNRASVDRAGKPWAPHKPVIWWTASGWKGDVPDGGWPPLTAGSTSRYPFIMKPEGYAHIFGPGLADGPFPEHYEPLECPVRTNLLSPQLINPIIKRWDLKEVGTELDKTATCDIRFPYVATTYRVSEHWQTGVMTRWQPWLLELQPEVFVEMSRELAKAKHIKNGERVIVRSARGELKAVAMVTGRLRPFTIADQTIHQVGLPWHFGWRQPDPHKKELRSANLLTPAIGDPNTMIPETKAFMVDVIKVG